MERLGAGRVSGWDRLLFDGAFVINLAARTARRLAMTAMLDKAGASQPIFFDAVNVHTWELQLENGTATSPSPTSIPGLPDWSKRRLGLLLHRWAVVLPPTPTQRLPNDQQDWRNDVNQWPPNASVISSVLSLPREKMRVSEFVPWVAPVNPSHAYGLTGCYLSHLLVLLDAQRRGLQTFVVLEDDVAVGANANVSSSSFVNGTRSHAQRAFANALHEAVSVLPAGWDVLAFGWPSHRYPCVPEAFHRRAGAQYGARGATAACNGSTAALPKDSPWPICRVAGQLRDTAAYAVHQRALSWLIPLLSSNLASEDTACKILPLDQTLQAAYRDHHVYATTLPLVYQDKRGQRSDIGTTFDLIPKSYRGGMLRTYAKVFGG